MALTAQGRRLTETNRLLQLQLASQAAGVGLILWDQLQASNLDGSTPEWLASNTALASRYYDESSRTTAEYISQYRAVEAAGNTAPVLVPTFDAALTAQILLVAGPVRVKNFISRGFSGSSALAAAKSGYAGMLRRQVMMGGRQTVDLTASQDEQAVGWRRVSDGNPCAFCAMLCSRGPVYRSASSAGDPVAGNGLHYHAHCGCHAEIVYGSWEPNEQEQGFIDAYQKAAREANAAGFARTQQSVLPRLRANGDFRDSPSVRNKTTQSDQDG
ncbi:hypothetical protein [Curtobacterium sp. SORGH_AS_0776]|uniref:VG15 protein n=1 Tax=Curtobacterium sp. SORGH_AS_0776 TaxID=3041798 RepID=UPI002865BE29|nr:hypothetical protein [Curtobacterium sp. SORGH_AS_0776]MDR6172642.1 hypothetical protein [Curtobacterium sp. SORGH_AS_0776]